LQSSHKQRTTRSATTTKQCAREAPDDGNLLEQLIMGQLISIPVSSDAAASDLDHRPKTISECMLRSGKVSIQLFHDFKKRSYEELDQHVADLLFTNSLLSNEEENEDNAQRQNDQTNPTRTAKRKRKEKQVVMYTDVSTGVRCRLHPRMSMW
jgi:hypothetical protein